MSASISTSTSSSFRWADLSVELQQLILEQMSYRELKIMQQVSKDMQSLTTSTSKLRSSLFLTEKVDLVALYKLVGLPQWADATAAKLEARNKGESDEDEGYFYFSQADEDYHHDDGGDQENISRFDSVADVIKLHPLIRTLHVYKRPDGGFDLGIPGDVGKAMQENVTSPPLGRVSVGVMFGYTGSGCSQRVGRPYAKSDAPVSVQQVTTVMAELIQQENGLINTLNERLPMVALEMAALEPGATMELRVSNQGTFELELQY